MKTTQDKYGTREALQRMRNAMRMPSGPTTLDRAAERFARRVAWLARAWKRKAKQ